MSCTHRSCPANGSAAPLETPCDRVRRLFTPCPDLRASAPANENDAPATSSPPPAMLWLTVIGSAAASLIVAMLIVSA